MGKKIKRSDHYFKDNRKKEQLLKKISKDVEKERRYNQSACLHTNDHGPDVRFIRAGQPDGIILFECRNCDKQIRGNKIAPKTLQSSADVLVSAMDTIKMQLDMNKPSDRKVANWIAECQYRCQYNIVPLYAATQKNKDAYAKHIPSIYGKPIIRKDRRN